MISIFLTLPTLLVGEAEILSQEGKITVVQSSPSAILEWDQFNFGLGEEIEFFLPEEGSVLNRVKGETRINGAVSSNGDLYLVSPKGIAIGKEADINSGRFFASTLSVLDAEYLNGSSLLFLDQDSQGIMCQGTVEAFEGSLVFLAPRLEVQGSLIAPEGTVGLGASSQVYLCGCGDQKIWLMGTPGAMTLEGQIEGYKIEARASSIRQKGKWKSEKITLFAAEALAVEGDLEVEGGEIHLIGNEISIGEEALIDASGDHGGGAVLIGGDLNGSFPRASKLKVASSAQIHADARNEGRGGKAVLYAELENWFAGGVSARGGKWGGDGGYIAIASPGLLHAVGTVSLDAPQGRSGEYLKVLE